MHIYETDFAGGARPTERRAEIEERKTMQKHRTRQVKYMLDISYLSHNGDQEPPRFSISESDLVYFEDAFSYLRQKTGVWIDAYGSCRVYPDHLKLLAAYLSKSAQPVVKAFVCCLNQAIKENETLLFDGD